MTNEIKVQLDSWRGYSAYEVAVQNGFKGTQKEWLESLSGGTLQITVCGKSVDASGNIVLYAGDILMAEGAMNTIASKMEALETDKLEKADVVDSLESTDGQKALSAKQGNVLHAAVLKKAEAAFAVITIPAVGWSGDGPYTVEVPVLGLKAGSAAVLSDYPDGGANEEAYRQYECKLVAINEDSVTIRAAEKPTQEVKANLLVIVPGVDE